MGDVLDLLGSGQIESRQTPVGVVTAGELSVFFGSNISKLDKDKNKFVTKDELKAAQSSGEYSGRDLNLLNILCQKHRTLEGMSPDERHAHRDNDGITPTDMFVFSSVYDNLVSQLNANKANHAYLTANFDNLDKNGDKHLEFEEIVLASQNSRRFQAERGMLTQIAMSYGRMMKSSDDEWGVENDGITKADLAKYGVKLANSITWNPHYLEHYPCTKTFPSVSEIIAVLKPKD